MNKIFLAELKDILIQLKHLQKEVEDKITIYED